MNCCISCRWFKDAEYSRTYVCPRCTVRGDDDCAYMRQNVCGLDGSLFEPKPILHPQPPTLPLPA